MQFRLIPLSGLGDSMADGRRRSQYPRRVFFFFFFFFFLSAAIKKCTDGNNLYLASIFSLKAGECLILREIKIEYHDGPTVFVVFLCSGFDRN